MIGYDDSAFMSCTDPPLTTVRQPIEAIGRAAVEMLAGQIEGAAVSTDELFFEPEMVARGSTAAAPAALAARRASARRLLSSFDLAKVMRKVRMRCSTIAADC